MSETLWITLPTNEENELKEVINSIKREDLRNLSLNQLLSDFQAKKNYDQGETVIFSMYEEANKWQNILRNYSAIIEQGKQEIHLNTDTVEMLSRMNSVKSKFREHGKSELAEKEFAPNELLCLIIMCYTNPTLIGPKLCQALKDNNLENIKKEMIENSAYSKAQRRVLPFSSNLRLLSTALYFNDTTITLPTSMVDRVTRETIQKGLIVRKVDQRGGFTEVIDGPARASVQENAHRKRDVSEIDRHAVLQSLESGKSSQDGFVPAYVGGTSSSASPISYGNQSELTPEVLAIKSTNNTAPSVNLNPMLIMGFAVLAFANHIPVISAVGRNIIRSVKDTSTKTVDLTTSFFSSVKPIQPSKEERLEEQQPIFKTGYN